jgi:hypothetical protein
VAENSDAATHKKSVRTGTYLISGEVFFNGKKIALDKAGALRVLYFPLVFFTTGGKLKTD